MSNIKITMDNLYSELYMGKITGLEFYVNTAKTGIYVLSLGCCYGIGKASNLLINAILSRFTSEKKEVEP